MVSVVKKHPVYCCSVAPQTHAMPSYAAFIKIILNLVIKIMSFEVYSLRSSM